MDSAQRAGFAGAGEVAFGARRYPTDAALVSACPARASSDRGIESKAGVCAECMSDPVSSVVFGKLDLVAPDALQGAKHHG
jgi:hypothetical protein